MKSGDVMECDLVRGDRPTGERIPVKVKSVIYKAQSTKPFRILVSEIGGLHRKQCVKPKFLHER